MQLIKDLLNLNFLEKKTDTVQLYNMYDAFHFYLLKKRPYFRIKNSLLTNNNPCKFYPYDLCSLFEDKFWMLYEVLNIAPDEISIAGGSIAAILTNSDIANFDIYFHCTQDRANELFLLCIEYLAQFTIACQSSPSIETLRTVGGNIKFIKQAFQNKEEILMSFDLSASRVGFNIISGFFTTICGLVATVYSSFPVDTNASVKRLQKYVDKGYTIFLNNIRTVKITETIKDDSFYSALIDNDYQNLTLSKSYNYHDIMDETAELVQQRFHLACLQYDGDGPFRANCFGYDDDYEDMIEFFREDTEKFLLADNKLAVYNERRQYYYNLADVMAKSIRENHWKVDYRQFDNWSQRTKVGISGDEIVVLKQLVNMIHHDLYPKILAEFIVGKMDYLRKRILTLNY